MEPLDHDALAARIARVSWHRLADAARALSGSSSPHEAVERAVARDLVGRGFFDEARSYVHTRGRTARATPRTLPSSVRDALFVTASFETIRRAEALAHEVFARLAPYGFSQPERFEWRVTRAHAQRAKNSDGAALVEGPFVYAARACDGLAASSFDARAFASAGAHIDASMPLSPRVAAASVLTLRTAWRALAGDPARSPAEPLIELFALGTALELALHDEPTLLLAEPQHPPLVCAQCATITLDEGDRDARALRRACARCGDLCARCAGPALDGVCPCCAGPLHTLAV